MRHTDPAEEAALLDAIERWLEKEVRPQVMRLEHDDIYPHELVGQMKEMGLFGAVLDPQWGGLGLSASTYAKIVMQISTVWMSLTGIFNSHLMMAILVEKFGSAEQKARFLPRMAAGELRGALGLTEPDAGTDLAAIRTRAVKEGDHYVVNGTKTWISNGIEGNCCAVLVRTDAKAQPPRKGLSMFIMEKGPGFRASRKLEKIGYKGIDSAELVFENFRVPAANLIGGEGQGFYCAVSGLELGRINVAARGAGIAKAALDESVRYAQLRKTFGKPIGEHQAIQLKLGEMATRFEAARLLIEQAAQAYDAGRRCDMEAGMAKYFASEAGLENALEAMRIHGAYGYSKEFPIERLVRDAPLMCIGEGTNEMQRIIIARQLIERNPA
ncbi:MAG TPA: acyl-CoA dehydrogenase family protein [Burkholderiales bacterium]|jgi:alkylation response protein AidB-like acyl-CoA dehydrogenase|nr:acyl-CoA dehydrogenase family protein [Burkholderiales bacterium]